MRGFTRWLLSAVIAGTAGTGAVRAQDAGPPATSAAAPPAAAPIDDIVVTATPSPTNRIRTSTSVSEIYGDEIDQEAPRSAAEALRNVPGIRVESSGGEGNANINVRGLPVSTGGAKYIALEEDGLPIVQFGDLIFGNADFYLRTDDGIDRIETVRGGSASTFISNAPGGVINFISKTGKEAGGDIAVSRGVDYDYTRIDFNVGGLIDGVDGLRGDLSGFYRYGEGPRKLGFAGDDGGQLKGNLTYEFDGGFVRLYGKYLDDRTPGYLPYPVGVTGTNGSPTYTAIPGFNPNQDTLYSKNFRTDIAVGPGGRIEATDVRDGVQSLDRAIGFEAEYELPFEVRLRDSFRYSSISGQYTSPFPTGVGDARTIADSIGGPGATIRYADGPGAGFAIADPARLNNNGLLATELLFNVKINSFSNTANDFQARKTFDTDAGTIGLTAGFYKADQAINTDWYWNSYLSDVKRNSDHIDVYNAAGQKVTLNGIIALGALARSYGLDYDINAPYLDATWDIDDLSLDASIRYDLGSASGTYYNATTPGTSPFDITGNAVLSPVERNASYVNFAAPQPLKYAWYYISYSAGANYLVTPDLAVFARSSIGGRVNSDRLIYSPFIRPDGGAAAKNIVNQVDQYEAGAKYRADALRLYATFFYAITSEENSDVTTGQFFSNRYDGKGVELEGSYSFGDLSIRAGTTYTSAQIAADNLDPTLNGHTPRRQATVVYQVTPVFTHDAVSAGVNVTGTTASYTQDLDALKLPPYAVVNVFASYRITPAIQLGFTVNNLLDTNGFTEAEDAAITNNAVNYVRSRSINGRTTLVTLRATF